MPRSRQAATSIRAPRKARYAAPPHRNTAAAVSLAVTTADTPAAAAAAQASTPAVTPNAADHAARLPEAIAVRNTIVVSRPGVIVISPATTAKPSAALVRVMAVIVPQPLLSRVRRARWADGRDRDRRRGR